MINVFLHPNIIYKQTQLYQMELEALARSDAMQEEVFCRSIKSNGRYFVNVNSFECSNLDDSQKNGRIQ